MCASFTGTTEQRIMCLMQKKWRQDTITFEFKCYYIISNIIHG